MAVAVEQLRRCTEIAFSTLAAHLRTPPAPTFAPLASSLLSLLANIRQNAHMILWKNAGAAQIYNSIRRTFPSYDETITYVLHHTSSNTHQWDRFVGRLQSLHASDWKTLPHKLVEPPLDSTVSSPTPASLRPHTSLNHALETKEFQEDVGQPLG